MSKRQSAEKVGLATFDTAGMQCIEHEAHIRVLHVSCQPHKTLLPFDCCVQYNETFSAIKIEKLQLIILYLLFPLLRSTLLLMDRMPNVPDDVTQGSLT